MGKLKNMRESVSQQENLKKPPITFSRLFEGQDILGRPKLITEQMLRSEQLKIVSALLDKVMTLIPQQSVLDTLESVDEVIVKHTFNPLVSMSARDIKILWKNEELTETVALIIILRNSII